MKKNYEEEPFETLEEFINTFAITLQLAKDKKESRLELLNIKSAILGSDVTDKIKQWLNNQQFPYIEFPPMGMKCIRLDVLILL